MDKKQCRAIMEFQDQDQSDYRCDLRQGHEGEHLFTTLGLHPKGVIENPSDERLAKAVD